MNNGRLGFPNALMRLQNYLKRILASNPVLLETIFTASDRASIEWVGVRSDDRSEVRPTAGRRISPGALPQSRFAAMDMS